MPFISLSPNGLPFLIYSLFIPNLYILLLLAFNIFALKTYILPLLALAYNTPAPINLYIVAFFTFNIITPIFTP